MDLIFHEKQEGSLCAQHCLNSLLQGSYFTAVDLASIAEQIDEEERQHMAEGGAASEDYCRFLQQPSGNMDDSGFFSVQVIANALKVWSLDLVPYSSKSHVAQLAQHDATSQKAYICNYKEHWLTVRKIGKQWFNLNSLLTGPELLSNTYLSMFLIQLQKEGYSIFIIIGNLPESEADHVLNTHTAVQHERPKILTELRKDCDKSAPSTSEVNGEDDDDDAALQEALHQSLVSTGLEKEDKSPRTVPVRIESENCTEEEMLEIALKMSLEMS